MNSQARNALRRLEQQRAAGSFGDAAALCPVPPDAKVGDRFIIRLPDNIRLADERSRVRPAILWGIYRDGDGNIVAADFFDTSTRQNGKQDYSGRFPLSFIKDLSGKTLESYVKTCTLYTFSNRSHVQGGFIKNTSSLPGRGLIPYLPDLIVRRVSGLCMNNALMCFQEPGLGLSGTVREGVYFPMLKPCNLRGDMLARDEGKAFVDWRAVSERNRFPNGRPGADHGNCNSVTQPLPEPALSRL